MSDLLYKIKWEEPEVLVPGNHSTEPDSQPPWKCISEIIPGLYLTCEQEVRNRQVAIEMGMALILNMCALEDIETYEVYLFDEGENIFLNREIKDFQQFVYELNEYTSYLSDKDLAKRKTFIYNIPAVDTPNYLIENHFPLTSALIRLVLCNRTLLERNNDHWTYEQLHAVVAHCMVGVSRSASIVAAYLMKKAGITRNDALSFIQMVRPVVNPNNGFRHQLLLWEATKGQRIVDELSARLVASQINNEAELFNYIYLHLPLLLKNSKFYQERQYFGLVISLTQPSQNTLVSLYQKFESNVTEAIISEDYTDIPNFFANVSDIISSLQIYCEDIFVNLYDFDTKLIFNDSFYFKVIKSIACSGFMKEIYDTVRAFCFTLKEADLRYYLSDRNLCVSFPKELFKLEIPKNMVVSFPFLAFIAPYAEGFIKPPKLLSLASEFRNATNGRSFMRAQEFADIIKEEFLDIFLLSLSSKNTDFLKNSSSAMECEFNISFSFLKNDLEIQVLETFRTNKSVPFNILISCLKELHWQLGQTLILKLVSGLLAFRLLLEAVEQFLLRICDNNLPKGIRLSERELPLALIDSFIKCMESLYIQHFHKPCGIVSFLRRELEPLFEVGVLQADGLWSIL
ncbi:unnamed protein product [Phytomonas sp. Hart1]|nr:unnamed protein product [Phytomonas sp. Hart1]|eukprot:CCW68727.1 unnamed protein product [Phytomonas sp. isolate Hart1]